MIEVLKWPVDQWDSLQESLKDKDLDIAKISKTKITVLLYQQLL